ncbi:MAG TPA: PEGA domain-containing protein [Polyangiaceae bacterium]
MMKTHAQWFGGAALCLASVATRHASAEAVADVQQAAPAVVGAPAASPDAVKEAAGRYTRGLSLYGDGEFLLALVEFERAYELSKNYKVLYNIGQVRIQLGRYAQGREALAEYLRLGGENVNAERLAAVNKDLAMLVERTASLNIVANQPGADISLDGKVIGTSPLSAPLVVDAGEHSLVLHKSGYYDRSQSVTLAGREQIDVTVELVPVAEVGGPRVVVERPTERVAPAKPSHAAVWVGWSTTGALAVTAGVTGYLGIAKANDLQSMRTELGVTRGQLDNAKSSANTLLIISDVTTGFAVVAGGVSLYLSLAKPAERPPGARAQSMPPSLALRVAPGSLALRGAF